MTKCDASSAPTVQNAKNCRYSTPLNLGISRCHFGTSIFDYKIKKGKSTVL